MYAIVEYVETKEIDFLPMKWMVDGNKQNVKSLIKDKTALNFYYPPVKAASKVSNAKKICGNPEEHWLLYKVRILGTANTLKSANEKTKQAEDTSNVDYDTDDYNNCRNLEAQKIRKRKHSFDYENDVADDEIEDSYQENRLITNTSISMVTKPTPPQHLRAIQSSSRSSLSQNVPVLKHLPQSSTSDHQPNVIQPDMLPSHSKNIMETSAQVLNSINSTVLMQKLLTTLEEVKETQKTHSVMLQSIMRKLNTPQLENDNELPNDIHFPLSNIKEVNDFEEQRKDQSIKRTLKRNNKEEDGMVKAVLVKYLGERKIVIVDNNSIIDFLNNVSKKFASASGNICGITRNGCNVDEDTFVAILNEQNLEVEALSLPVSKHYSSSSCQSLNGFSLVKNPVYTDLENFHASSPQQCLSLPVTNLLGQPYMSSCSLAEYCSQHLSNSPLLTCDETPTSQQQSSDQSSLESSADVSVADVAQQMYLFKMI